mmetsp:Transcript_33340/g.131380  ORF Transcript_33340/g.131380 Transcript_33340/m.131380 type:complete len:351 (-) Transcript_33340:2272-3324(-)|eukprot:CAMPEP_0113958690 /NCGR_PEP_ID=MMETSP0011_2-20120614/3624_1 /TAXON_ID=101924 /ORGANISM="Rhodosorus marinus" /LENGTH=350 /DNA_ID=CAMNT_0000969709 /DNA_START=830 /DNA_END=1882 /DNA_ORIENTATION=+ /assembly_acc=CAM_ASM_000156
MIKLRLNVPVEGKSTAIEFNFDPAKDTPASTSKEIALEFNLNSTSQKEVKNAIEVQLQNSTPATPTATTTTTAATTSTATTTTAAAAAGTATVEREQSKPELAVFKRGAVTVVAVKESREDEESSDEREGLSRGILVKNSEQVSNEMIEHSARGNVDMVQVCLTSGADINFRNYGGRTALHLAAAENQEDVARYLLQNGADMTIKDERGSSPVREALGSGSYLVVQAFHDFGAEIGESIIQGLRQVHVIAGFELISAAGDGDLASVRRLIREGVDPSSKNYDSRTALHLAAAENNEEIALELFHHGVDPYAQDRWGVTSVGEALRNGNSMLASSFGYKDTGVLVQPELNF